MDGGHFKVGDEVTLIAPTPWTLRKRKWWGWRNHRGAGPMFGEVVTVSDVGLVDPSVIGLPGGAVVFLRFSEHAGSWFCSLNFRKVIRRSISEWLETSTEYEEPRRVPAPREVEGV